MSSADGANSDLDRVRATRRQLIAAAATGLANFAAACAAAPDRTEIVETPEGRVLQWERDDLLVLVSGLLPRYQRGDRVVLQVILNNQSTRAGLFRIRARLIGRGQQVVLDSPPATVRIEPFDAGQLEQTLQLPTTLQPGDYTLAVELPPWDLAGRSVGGGVLAGPISVLP